MGTKHRKGLDGEHRAWGPGGLSLALTITLVGGLVGPLVDFMMVQHLCPYRKMGHGIFMCILKGSHAWHREGLWGSSRDG